MEARQLKNLYTTSSVARRTQRAFSILLSTLFALGMHAQTSKPSAALDKDVILIGQQAKLELSLTYRVDGGATPVITWPTIGDTLTSHIEVVHDTSVDTVPQTKDGDPYLFQQLRTITITSFDSGYWAIPPFLFLLDGDTVETSPLLITVNTVQVDTAGAFKDIKEIYEVPWSWKDWLRENWTWLASGTVVLAILTTILILLLRKRRTAPITTAPEVVLPLHERALQALAELDRKQLWQQGLYKEYHSGVTDILRSYIEERFRIPALESTTDELLGALRMSSMTNNQREQLANLLRMADMVKFAKWTPLPAENEQLMAGSVQLIQQTTEVHGQA